MFGSCTHGMLVLVILSLNSFRNTQSAVFQEDTRLCHERCYQNGNCNGESGKCDCPYGFTGRSYTGAVWPSTPAEYLFCRPGWAYACQAMLGAKAGSRTWS